MKRIYTICFLLLINLSLAESSIPTLRIQDVVAPPRTFGSKCEIDPTLSDSVAVTIIDKKYVGDRGAVTTFDVYYKNPIFIAKIRFKESEELSKKEYDYILESYKKSQKEDINNLKDVGTQAFLSKDPFMGSSIVYFRFQNVIISIFSLDQKMDKPSLIEIAKNYARYLMNLK